MQYEKIKSYKDEAFRRLSGEKGPTFKKMIGIHEEAEKEKKARGGKPNALRMEKRLLMGLEYIREYRRYFDVASCYGL